VNDLIIPYSYLLDFWGRDVSLVKCVQFAEDILHHAKEPFIELIVLGLMRLQLETIGLIVARLATVTA